MGVPRRRFLQMAAAGAALPLAPRQARAQAYPSRQVRLVVGFSAGGGSDILARLAGAALSEQLGQPFIIENRTGAGSNIATEIAVNAAPDGHTLLLATTANAVNATLYDKLSYNFIADIAPVAGLLRAPNVMLVNPSVPAKTVPEFIAYARANPTKVNMGSGGNGGPVHMAGELFKMLSDVNLVHVPYRGESLALTDLLAGQVQVVFGSIPSSIGYIQSGTLRPLAVTTTSRSEKLPDVPVLADFVPGYEMSTWYGIGAPRKTPEAVIEKLNVAINAVLVDPGFRTRVADLGGVMLGGSPAELAVLIEEQTAKWRQSGQIRAPYSDLTRLRRTSTLTPEQAELKALAGIPRRDMIVRAGIQQHEFLTQLLRQLCRIVTMDRQPAAFFRTVSGEGRDDGITAGDERLLQPRDIGRAVGLLDQKMKRGAVMPDVEALRRLPRRHVLDDPLDFAGAPAQP